MEKYNYYKNQLEKIDFTKSHYNPTFQIKHESGQTHNMDLNKESAKELKQWLEANFDV